MIIARSMGRLGNQIFQVAAGVSHLGGRESFLGLGFGEYTNLFAPSPVSRLRFTQRFSRQVTQRIFHLLHFCARMRLVGRLSYSGSGDTRKIVRVAGLIPLCVLEATYPNDERYFDPIVVEELVFRQGLSSLASPAQSGGDRTVKRCFVHVRRGDFMSWPTIENPAAVPESWFTREMQRMQERFGDCEFVVITDGSLEFPEILSFPGTVVGFSGSSTQAFLEMLRCDAGILSPSSFSWWAAWYLSRKGVRTLVAPMYWNNWMESTWKNGISESSFLLYTLVGNPPEPLEGERRKSPE